MKISDKLLFATQYLKNELVINAPYKTGNLALNSIRIAQKDGNFNIVIGGLEVAPYAIYTNEVWINRPGKNPNEGWVQNTINKSLPFLRRLLSGALTSEEYYRDVAVQQRKIETLKKRRIRYLEKEKLKIGG